MTDKPEVNPDTPAPQSPFATPTVPKPAKPPVTTDLVIGWLMDLPEDICDFQVIFDTVSMSYAAHLSDLTFKAFNTLMFPGKKDGEPLRVASNEEERRVAVSQVIAADEKMKILTREFNEAQRELTLAKMKYESAKIIANLLGEK